MIAIVLYLLYVLIVYEYYYYYYCYSDSVLRQKLPWKYELNLHLACLVGSNITQAKLRN